MEGWIFLNITIFLRHTEKNNYFRRVILKTIASKIGDEAILCSGFFQELFKESEYQVTLDGNLSTLLTQSNIRLTTIGIHNSNWMKSYKNFVNNLKNDGVSHITSYYVSGFKFHAKIYIYKKENNPLLGIIGSSNMTRNAFGLSSPFNYEADVVLWDDSCEEINELMLKITKGKSDPYDCIKMQYIPEDNQGITILDRLRELEKMLNNLKLKKI